jgi:hypothetical protein
MKEKKNCKNLDHESWVLTFKLSLTFIWSIFMLVDGDGGIINSVFWMW